MLQGMLLYKKERIIQLKFLLIKPYVP